MNNKSVITLLLISIIGFLIAVYASLMQVFGIQSVEKATIISGVLSMIGGFAGALGAYFVASNQMNKQFQKQDKDRVIELRIEKLNETLEIINEFLHVLQLWRGMSLNVEMSVKKCIDKEYTHVVESDIFVDSNLTEIKDQITKLVSLKDTLKKNKIFLSGLTDLEEIYESTRFVVDSNQKFTFIFDEFKTVNSIWTSEITPLFNEVIIDINRSYKNLDKEIHNVISLLEDSIKKLLNLN